MRLVTRLSLATATAITAMAFVGSSMAFATHNTSLCKAKETVCAIGNQYPAGTELVGTLKTGTEAVLSGPINVKCKEGSVRGEISNALGKTLLLGTITAVEWSNCNTCNEPIKGEAATLPWESHLLNLGGLKGLLTILNPAVLMEKCTFLKINCLASAAEVSLDVDTSVTPPVIKAEAEPLNLSCGKGGAWTAEYVLTSPSPVYIEE